ncbi:MAG: hypothetical protein Q8L81_10820 [Bacteroidota bacterium]|nr:hypothetical protein [Bacteroidota bacterium]
MKQITFSILLCITIRSSAQTKADTIALLFKNIETATANFKNLWGKDIYGPVLMVDPVTRMAYANMPDSFGVLKPDGLIFYATLPSSVIIANASIRWNGYTWAMMMEPFLPANEKDRVNLFCHELFHVSQASLGFILKEANNNHIDTKDGRIYLRLELNALKKAVNASSKKEIKEELTNAMIFRKYRRSLFPLSDSTENMLELNEGIAEYTGAMMSGRSEREMKDYFIRKMDDFLKSGAFVRTFAYRTIPVYGYFLKESKQYWNKDITIRTNLTSYLIKQLNISLPGDISTEVKKIRNAYNYEQILDEETEKEEKTNQLIEFYKAQFFDNPSLKINFEKKKASFDARTLVTIPDKGIVYPTTTVTDVWGVLTVDKAGALMSPDRNSMLITAPQKTEGNLIAGEGWLLKLNEGYEVIKEGSGNYKLIRKK